MSLRQIVLFVHLSAAVFWIGEMFFVAAVVGPYSRSLADPGQRVILFREVGRRSLPLVWTAIVTLVVTGMGNLALMGVSWREMADTRFYQTGFGRFLAVKLVVVAVMITLSAIHDFVHGTQTRRLRTRLHSAPESERPALAALYAYHRRRAAWIGRLNLALGIAVLFLAAGLIAAT